MRMLFNYAPNQSEVSTVIRQDLNKVSDKEEHGSNIYGSLGQELVNK
jgi:hypothetical protein